MRKHPTLPLAALRVAVTVLALLLTVSPAPASITFGALSNFDVFNDTGQETHGFEIELHGVSSRDVTYTFGAPYQRYGNPHLVDFVDASGVPGVYVRYESPYDPATGRFTQATPLAPNPVTPTAGHSCYNGGPIGNYATSGCEHFGVGVNGSPASTVYRWLVADPATPGALQPAGTKVSIPAPVFNVLPPPPPADPLNPPANANQPVVQALLPAEPPQAYEFGDAQWVKVFVREIPSQADLNDLVTDNPAVPQDQGEVEIEWILLQADVNAAGNRNELFQEGQLGEGNESIIRRYEFYKYTGAYDPETHEARPINDTSPVDANGVNNGDLGDYIGAQMAAVNIGPAAPAATVSVSVSKTGAGTGTVTSTPAGIDCGPTCAAPFTAGAPVTLTAAPAAGSFFAGWGGDCAGPDLAAALTPSVDTTCIATFELLAGSADLSLSAKQSPVKARATRRVQYNLRVKNSGPGKAVGAVLTVTITGLPAADLASIRAPRGCTVSGNSVTCPLGDLANRRTASKSISVVPSVAGPVTMTAELTSATADPVAANDTAAITTVVQ